MDETGLQVLKENGKAAQSDKWMWVSRAGPPQQASVLFDYDPSRAGSVPERLLEGFNGTLHVDGYSGYDRVCRQYALKRIGCWDHVRRTFRDASKAVSHGKGKVSKADVALSQIRKLYRVEKHIKALSIKDKQRSRQTLSLPLLNDFKQWLDNHAKKTQKGSLTRKAMDYALNQ